MNKWPKLILVGVGGLVLSLVAVSLLPSTNDSTSSGTPLAVISKTPATEIPAAAANLVRQASGEARSVVARQVLEAVHALEKPCALPYVVAAMTKVEPAIAPQAVVTAAELQPQESLAVVKAAVAAAPQFTGDILFEFSQKMPEISFAAAQVAALVAADQSVAAVRAVGRALPGFAPFVEKALQHQANAGRVDVTTTLKQAQEMASVAAREQQRKEAGAVALASAPQSTAVPSASASKPEAAGFNNLSSSELVRAQPASAQPATPAVASYTASATFKAPAKAVSPASLKVPSPEQVKSQVDELVRPNNYPRP
jgi:hypothetical protein